MNKQKEIQVLLEQVVQLLQKVRTTKPLIHMIPNDVSAALCADAIAAIGARPIMAVAKEEVASIVGQARSLVINSGQLTVSKQEAIYEAVNTAIERDHLIVVDPVGAGASEFRLAHAKKVVEMPWKGILKVNTSEYYALTGQKLTYTGVDGIHGIDPIKGCRDEVGYVMHHKTICITGEIDYIGNSDGWTAIGHYPTRLPRIVGSGCMLGALCGVFSAVTDEPYLAAVSASLISGIVSQIAEEQAKGYGDYKMYLLDALYNLDDTAVYTYGGILLEKGAQNGKNI